MPKETKLSKYEREVFRKLSKKTPEEVARELSKMPHNVWAYLAMTYLPMESLHRRCDIVDFAGWFGKYEKKKLFNTYVADDSMELMRCLLLEKKITQEQRDKFRPFSAPPGPETFKKPYYSLENFSMDTIVNYKKS